MVCPNCQSKEVIKVQDEWFCTSCGTVLPNAAEAAAHIAHEPTPASSEPTADEVAAAELPAGVTVSPEMAAVIPTITNHAKTERLAESAPLESAKPKKRKVGRPKLKRLDTPKTPELAVEPTVDPVVTEAPKLTVATAPSIAKVEPPKAPPTAKTSARRMNDLAPRRGEQTSSVDHDQPTSVDAANEAESASKTKPKSVLHHPPLNYTEIEAESWAGRFHWRYALLMVFPAVLLALLAGGFVAAWLNQTPANLLKITHTNLYTIAGEVVLVLALYYISHTLASAALTFGIARDSDHRAAPKSRWWGVAVNSFGAHLRLDLGATLSQLLGSALIVALVITGGIDWHVPETVQIGALLIAFFVMLYLLAGVGLAQSLGRVSVTLGVVPAHKALGLGWDFFRHHFDLVGGRLIGLLLDIAMIVPFAALAIAIGIYAPSGSGWAVVALSMVGVITVGALMGAGGAIWWQAVYRKLVRNERITEVMSLLAGRQAERPKRPQLVVLSIFATILFVLSVVWPLLPLPSP